MTKEFVPYEPALALKELGFDEPCIGYYLCRNSAFGIDDLLITTEWIDLLPYDSSSCKAPTYSQAFTWFREKYDLFCWIEKFHKDETYIFQIPPANFTKIQGHFKTYEEAELACLIKLIEIVKNK